MSGFYTRCTGHLEQRVCREILSLHHALDDFNAPVECGSQAEHHRTFDLLRHDGRVDDAAAVRYADDAMNSWHAVLDR